MGVIIWKRGDGGRREGLCIHELSLMAQVRVCVYVCVFTCHTWAGSVSQVWRFGNINYLVETFVGIGNVCGVAS